MDKKWIWEHPNYPNFEYDQNIVEQKIQSIRERINKLGYLFYELDDLGSFALFLDSLSTEIYSSWKIEGEVLDRKSVRASILKRIVSGLPDSPRMKKYEGVSSVVADSKTDRSSLTLDRVLKWHKILFGSPSQKTMYKINAGEVRKNPMRIVSGFIEREKTLFEAPPPESLEKELDSFFDYIKNTQDDLLVKTSIAHLWFVIIHPLDDGNGRITRLIMDHILSQTGEYIPSISRAIELDYKRYYDALERTNVVDPHRPLDITDWMIWHLDMIGTAYQLAINDLSQTKEKGKIRIMFKELSANEFKFADLIIEGNILNPTAKKYRKVNNNVTEEEALTAIKRMNDMGVFNYLGVEIYKKTRNTSNVSNSKKRNS